MHRTQHNIRLVAVRRMFAIRDFEQARACVAARDFFDLIERAVLVILALNGEDRRLDGGQFALDVEGAKIRM